MRSPEVFDLPETHMLDVKPGGLKLVRQYLLAASIQWRD
jgi:hypothetical protein